MLLDIRGLVVGYRPAGRGQEPVRAVDEVDLHVAPGEVVGLIGESGCGKTSLLRASLGLIPRAAGSIQVAGLDPHTIAPHEEPKLRLAAQLLFQDAGAALNPGLTLTQTLAESCRVFPGSSPAPTRIEDALRVVGLLHRAHALPAELSGGEKRRATLAQLHLASPRLTLADEPTAGLDAARKAELLDLLLARQTAQTAVLLVSHDLPLVLYACTRILVMSRGRIVDTFTPATLGAASRHPVTRELLEAAGMRIPEATA